MMTETMTISVFLVEDHELVRRGLRQLLQNTPDLALVGEANSVQEALRAIPQAQPDVVLIDLRLPDGLGTEVVRGLKGMIKPPRTLILTSYAEDDLVLEAMSANVNGYLLKDIEGEELIEGIRKAHAGRAVYSHGVSAVMASLVRGEVDTQDQRGKLDALSSQEYRVLAEVSKGKSNKQVADALGLSEKTVKNYLSNILSKLGYNSRTEAAVNFVKHSGRADE